MSSFLYLAGRRAVKARKLVVLVWVSVLAVLGGLVFLNMGSLDNSVEIPGTESGDALEQLAATFPQVAGASAQIVVTGPGVVDEGASAQAINNATDALTALPDVDTVIMGIGGGFIVIPAMIYLLRMPTNVVIGTSQFQVLVISSLIVVLQSIATHTVERRADVVE